MAGQYGKYPSSGNSFISSVSDSDSIDLTVSSGDLSADLKISAVGADAANQPVDLIIETDGLRGQVSDADIISAIPIADTSTTGLLSSTDWNTFNNKQAALTPGAIQTATAGLSVTNGANSTVGPNVTISADTASSLQPGLLSAADWSTFNSKQAALTPGSISTSTTGVSVGSGSNSTIGPNVTVDVQTASGSQPGLLSSADWTTFNNKQASGNYLTDLTGDVAASGPGSATATLATVNSNVGSFGSATDVSTITVNAKGLVTAASNTAIQIAESQVTNLVSDLAGKQVGPLTGDVTTSGAAATLATVNSNVGSFTNANITVNAKGLITAASSGSGSTASFYSPVVQVFTASGTYNRSYVFVVTSANATAGATYTNNSVTFTVIETISSGTVFIGRGNNVPASSGTLTKASGTGDATITFSSYVAPLYLIAEASGSGGGGGGAATTAAGQTSNGAGGAAGGYAKKTIRSGFGVTETVTVGAGGAGGTAGNTGTAGNVSSFGTFASASGGNGGNATAASSGVRLVAGSSGGAGSLGDLLVNGGYGGNGSGVAANSAVGGAGGASFFGGGGPASVAIAGSAPGTAGTAYGSGGSGASNGTTGNTGVSGGAGAAGVVIVTECYQ